LLGFAIHGMGLPPPIAQLSNVDAALNGCVMNAFYMFDTLDVHVCWPVMEMLFSGYVVDVKSVSHSSFQLFVYMCMLHMNSMMFHMTVSVCASGCSVPC
jgi:hypothetical protein